MQVIEQARDADFALSVSLMPSSSVALAEALPELKSALLDWMEKRRKRCVEVTISITTAQAEHDSVQKRLEDLRDDTDLAPLLRRASVQVSLLDDDGTPVTQYTLTADEDASTAIQPGAAPTAISTGQKTKPPPTKKSTQTRDNQRPRRAGQDSSAGSMALIVILILAIPAVLVVCLAVVFIGMSAIWVGPARNDVAVEMPAQVIEEVQPVPALFQPPIVPAQAPPDVAGKKTIDLIPLIDPQRDAVDNRKWLVRNNTLYCDDGNFVPRLQTPYQPPDEYDFTVVFSQPGLRNGISLIMPNPNGGSFFWHVGSGNGSVYGFHANPDKGGQQPGLVQANVPCTTTVQVRKNGVRGLVNGNIMMTVNTDYRDLLCDGWRNIPDKSVLAVACDDPTVFYFVRVVEITGQGKRTR